jgi:hypothetical protein
MAQGTLEFVDPIVLVTENNKPLTSASRTVAVSDTLPLPQLEFSFAFSTEETVEPGAFLDSFSVTMQDPSGVNSVVLLTTDAGGLVWAPPTPGTLFTEPDAIQDQSISIPFPAVDPKYDNGMVSYRVSAPILQPFIGKDVNVFFDLFNNENNLNSMGVFGDLAVVPEPAALQLGLLGAFIGFGVFLSRRSSP